MSKDNIDEDYQLFLDATQGNERAFNKLYSKHKDYLYGKIRFKERNLFRECAEKIDVDDIFQDVWIKVIKGKSFLGKSTFKTFLTAICSKHCIDVFRRTKTKKPENTAISLDDDAITNNIEDDIRIEIQRPFTLEELNMLEQDKEMVLSMLTKLSAEKRDIFYLRAAGDMTYDEIAKSMDINIDRVKDQFEKAKNELKRLLKMQLPSDGLGDLYEEQL